MKPLNLFVCATLAILLFCASVFAQTPAKLAFEVASIKPSPPLSSLISEAQSGKLDMGIRMDGTRVDFKFMSVMGLLAQAYKIKPYQISGPEWMKTQLFEIHAKLPEGSNKDQIPEMMQTLLAERFNLTFHRETRELQVYALIVGKEGLKMKEAAEAPSPSTPAEKESAGKEVMSLETPQGQVKMKQEGNSIVMNVNSPETGPTRMVIDIEKKTMRMEIAKIKMKDFTDLLTQFADRQVVDRTELAGSYEVPLELPLEELASMARKMMPELAGMAGAGAGGPGAAVPSTGLAATTASDPSGGSMFKSVQKLGLKLDPRKEPTEIFIIDRIDKEPTEN